ncbi:MAG: NYN domain-containing protein, partial [Ktedonobacterales bacterium]
PEAPAVSAVPTQPEATAQAETSEQPHARAGGRSRRRPSSGRKSDVQLVIPPSAEGESAPAIAATSDTQPPTAEVRLVPITTESVEPATPLTGEPESPVAAARAPVTAESPQPRRYRFERKATAAPYAPASRPERLSVAPATPAEQQPTTPPEAPAREAAEARPAFAATTFAPDAPDAPDNEALTSGAIDDIVTALGLRDTGPRRPPLLRLPVEPRAPSVAETETPAESAAEVEEPAETESGAEAEAETPGTSRRARPRRRRRGGSSHAASAGEEDAEETLAAEPRVERAPRVRDLRQPAALEEPEQVGRNGYEQYAPAENGAEYEEPYPSFGQAERQPWDVSQGQSQIGQPSSPFESPAPSVVRGFGPQPRGVAGPVRETYPRQGRTERLDTPPMSSNQLANMVTHAIQQQTDRLLNELRYHPQSPGMTVMLPQFPSTERVGVFVDVANLLYSSRNLRITVDFGKLLEFLHGNRRLIRAHAYSPTNPDPRADQSFLDAVKGLGYRITTKNYKTFASGAKKADMDLDLCMDIVRIVDAGAVDTIVLVSGDSDFLPLLEYCSDHGVRVEV